MTEMQAAVGCVQLGRLDGTLERKRANARWMGAELASVPDVTPPAAPPDREHTYMLYTVKVARERDRVLRGPQDRSIQARVSFPPVHRQPTFAGGEADPPVTDEVSEQMPEVGSVRSGSL